MVNYGASDIYSHYVFDHISVPCHFCRPPRGWGNCSGLAQIILWLKVRASMSLFPFPPSNNLRKTPMKRKTSNIKLFLTPAGLSKPIFQESTGCRSRVTVIFFLLWVPKENKHSRRDCRPTLLILHVAYCHNGGIREKLNRVMGEMLSHGCLFRNKNL